MACRGCSSDGCNCSVTGISPISVSGSGTPVTDPYEIQFDMEDALDAVTIDDATDCATLDDPHVLVRLGTGAVYLVPLPCHEVLTSPVPGNAFAFTWDTATDDDPGATEIRLNHATYGSATVLYVSDEDIAGTNVEDWLLSCTDGALKLYSRTDPEIWAVFLVSAATSGAEPNVIEFAVTYIDGNGSFNDSLPGDTVFDFTPQVATPPFGIVPIENYVDLDMPYTLAASEIGHMMVFNLAIDPEFIYIPNDADVSFPVGARFEIVATDQDVEVAPLDIANIVYSASLVISSGGHGILTNLGPDQWHLAITN